MRNIEAPPKQEFVLQDRRKISNIKELYELLGEISDEEFSFFVNDEKHDFATWIEHSLNSKFLAARVRRAKTRQDVQKELFMGMFT